MNDTDLLRFADECPWAVARLKRRHGAAVRLHLYRQLGSRVLVDSCLYLCFWILPQVAAEIRAGESVADFLRLIADCAIIDFRNLGRLAA
jgi:hypothetical protein